MTRELDPDTDVKQEHADLDKAGTNSAQMSNVGSFASLRIRNFRLLMTGTALSNASQWIQQVALNWLVYNLTGSGTMLGTLNLVRSIGSVSMIPVAGVLIDRLNRRKLMLMTNGWLFIITLVLGLLLVFGRSHISFLFVFAFLGGLVQSTDMALRQVVVFDLVPRRGAPNALALVQTVWSLVRSLGPSLGGFLILWFGPGGNFLVQSGACILIAMTIMQIKFPVRKVDPIRSSIMQNIRDGISYVARARVTRTFMMMGFVLPLFIIPTFFVLPPVYAKEVFGGGPEVLGFLMSAVGMGGIAGGIVTASLGRIERRGLVQLTALFLLSLSLIGFAFTTKLMIALPLLVLSGFFEIVFLATNQTLLQLSIPNEIRGRVTAIVNLNVVLMPLGGMIAGVGTDLLGGPKWITVVLCSIAACIAIGVFIGSPTIRNYRLSKATTDAESKT